MFYVTETRKDVELEVCNPQRADQVLTANMRDRGVAAGHPKATVRACRDRQKGV